MKPAREDKVTHEEIANAIRALAMDAVEEAKSGRPGLPMGAADIATVLFTKVLKYDAAAASWPDRDRFVLSAGHGSMLLYALLYLGGEPSMTVAELQRFRQLGSRTPGPSRIPPCAGSGSHNGSARPVACHGGPDGACRTHAECAARLNCRSSYICPRLRWRSHGGISQDVIIGEDGIFIGMTSFGASAPDTDVYNYFNVSPEAVAEAAALRCNS